MIATVLTNANSVAKIGTFGDEIGLTQIMIAIDPHQVPDRRRDRRHRGGHRSGGGFSQR